jgi:hypothetical protein
MAHGVILFTGLFAYQLYLAVLLEQPGNQYIFKCSMIIERHKT